MEKGWNLKGSDLDAGHPAGAYIMRGKNPRIFFLSGNECRFVYCNKHCQNRMTDAIKWSFSHTVGRILH